MAIDTPHIIEGTWEEILLHENELTGKRLRLIVLPDQDLPLPVKPNEKVLAALRTIAEHQKDRPFTDGTDSLRLLREARAGAMYGYEPTEER